MNAPVPKSDSRLNYFAKCMSTVSLREMKLTADAKRAFLTDRKQVNN